MWLCVLRFMEAIPPPQLEPVIWCPPLEELQAPEGTEESPAKVHFLPPSPQSR